MVKKDKNPAITEDGPIVTREKTQEAKVLFLHRFDASRPEPYKKLELSKAFTFYAAQERIKKEGGEWKAFVNNERVILRNYGFKKGERKIYGPGYLEAGHIFLCKFIKEDDKGNRIYRARFIGQCGNEIPDDDLMVLETPVVITERISATKTIVYTNVDYEAALWAGLIGLLVGLGLGYLFWFGSGGGTKIITTVAGAACSPGAPAPR